MLLRRRLLQLSIQLILLFFDVSLYYFNELNSNWIISRKSEDLFPDWVGWGEVSNVFKGVFLVGIL